ncbi:Chitinase A1 precursor [Pelotomaculum schinkii]|uniref:Chitinase A1 n=1 Tax=Pelotomaculum schinkii TaxID=78350 RepID=A0A4Y7RAD9_9FIRM|nr:choice-of-anchor Q domain-containing protein [Pelotomaculum schinkii]TEB05938.1 Chitinase A1 precursor [Pelotomaculum schinkii]
MRKKLTMILVVVFALLVCSAGTMAASEGRIIYVNCNATGDNTGSSWVNAFTSLQAALDVAQPGDEIWVAAGTYKPTSEYGLGIGERGKHFEMKNGAGIYGGFAGTESTRSGRDWTAHSTILSGDIGVEGNASDNCYHVFYHPAGLALNQTAVLDGFTVTGGVANSGLNESSPNVHGGGMYNYNSSPTLTNVTFSKNSSRSGGGIYNYNSSPTLTHVTFNGNSTHRRGGGMSNDHYSNPTLTNVTFSGNSTSGSGDYTVYGFGGGMYNNDHSSPTLTNVTFSGNRAGVYGGGMYNNDSSSPTLTNVTFSGNHSDYDGGGMSNNKNSSPKLTSVTFSNNSGGSGGGMYNSSSSPTLTNVIFNNNYSRGGGGMWNSSSSPTLTNVTFSGNNSSGFGGGMTNYYYSSPTLTNVTFSGNSASGSGGGMYNYASSSRLTNCILWGNSGIQIYNTDDSSATVTYSDIQGGHPGNGNIDADPLFVGPGNLRLQAGSPCINTGSNDAVTVTFDLDGNPRIVSFNVDMGAYEFSEPFPPGSPAWPSGSSLTAGNVTQNGLTLTWTAATDDVGVTSYKIYKNNNILDTVNLDTVDGTPTPYNVTGLTSGTRYVFKVEAGDAEGNWSATGPSVTVTTAASKQIIYVNCNTTGDNTGACWSNAFTTLQAALDVAQPGDEIWVAAGTYKPTSDYGLGIGERGKHFQMKNGVGIYGGFAGTESTRSGRDRTAHPAILSGDIGVEGDASDNCHHVFYHPAGLALNQTAVLDGCTVTGGNANGGNSASYTGGGMYNFYNNSPMLTNVTFSGNSAVYGGGMSNFNSSSPTLINVTFSGNYASNRSGGGMWNDNSSPKLTNVTFSGNSAGIHGGGMSNDHYSSPTLTNVTFSGNHSDYAGGGMENFDSSPTLTNVTFSGNTARNSGGGMYNHNSSPTLSNCILWGNSGAQIYDGSFSNPTVTYSDIQGGYPGNGNIDADPLFVGPGNLRLQADSPCINAGTNVPFEAGGVAQGVTTDLNGSPRITGDRVDMGAYEAGITDLISNVISKFQKLSAQQVKDALAIGQRIIESDTIPDILSPAQKSLLNNLGLTNAQVKSAYNSVISQLDTEEKIKDLQSGDLTKLANFLKTVEGSFDPGLRNTLEAKGITVFKAVKLTIDIAALTFDPFSNIPKADLEAILEGDLGIASETAASYGLNWANIEALRDSLRPPEKRKLKDILITIGSLSDSANLSGLTLSAGTLDPVFAPDITEYTVLVGNDVSGFTVTPTTADANATVEVDKKTVQSGNASETISFSGNARRVKVTVTVTAQSGTEKKYTLIVLKPK